MTEKGNGHDEGYENEDMPPYAYDEDENDELVDDGDEDEDEDEDDSWQV